MELGAAHGRAMACAVFCAGGYLLGSVLAGPWLAGRRGVDLEKVGSGNVGATNVGRALGRRAGLLVLVLDAAKGLVPALAGSLAFGTESVEAALIGLAPAVGHAWPIWRRGRGGKAAATTAGALLGVHPVVGAAFAGLYFLGKALTRRASVGSLAAAALSPALSLALEGTTPRTALAAALGGLVILRHRENLARLARGEEPPA